MADLGAFIEEELDRFGIPGAAVAVVRENEVLLARGFGRRDHQQEHPVTDRTLFPIGSTTKSFTAAAAATLVDDAVLDWDRPVRDYVPDFELSDPLASRDVTLRDMLGHRTGLPGHDMVWMMGGHGDPSRRKLARCLRHLEMNKSLRQSYQYSNLMYTAAGHVIEEVAGRSWEQVVAERILDPLGMSETSFSVADLRAIEDHASPHAEIDGRITKVPFREKISAVAPAGSMNSTIADMAAWVLMNCNAGRRGDNRIVSEESLAQMYAPTTPMPEGSLPWPETRLVGYALGWVIEYLHGRKMVWHNGGIDGFKAIVAFMPEEKVGIAVLTNRFPTLAPEALAHDVFTELLGLPSISWGERFRDLELQVAAVAEEEPVPSRPTVALPPRPLEDFAGTYEHPGYGRISFAVVDGELGADLPGLDITFTHRHHGVWQAKERIHGIELSFNFLADIEGNITRVEAHLEPAVRPVVFEKR